MEYSPFFMLLGLIVFFEAFYCYYYYYFNLFDFPFWKRKGPLIPSVLLGFPGGASGREPARQCRRRQRHREDPSVVRSPLEEEMATRSRILVWRIPWPQEAGGLQSAGSESDMTEQLTHIRQSVLQISRSLDLCTTNIWNGCFLFRGGGGHCCALWGLNSIPDLCPLASTDISQPTVKTSTQVPRRLPRVCCWGGRGKRGPSGEPLAFAVSPFSEIEGAQWHCRFIEKKPHSVACGFAS